MGPGGIATGGGDVILAFREHLAVADVEAAVEKDCSMHQVGCMGLCAKDVLVEVSDNGKTTTYQYIKPDMVERIVQEHIVEGRPVEEWQVKEDYRTFHEKQVKVVLSDCGTIDPESIDAYKGVEGYKAQSKVLKELSPEEAIVVIKDSGLRGRGGAGFPTGLKWELCSKNEADQKYIICNADEGDP
ncbi:hypothetical protein LCGC14_1906490, partial [marine sediment metagenome]